MNATTTRDTLLIVDDMPENIAFLHHFLSDAGFKVLIARDGEQGIETAQYVCPDLILLDVMMPSVDGFEVCKVLKSEMKTKDIPIIFMTALVDTVDKLKGFELGAADYITKPIQQEEVLARVNAHLSLRRMQQQLKAQNHQLKNEIETRKAIELSLRHTTEILKERSIELEKRNSELDALARTVAHDLKNPLNVVVSLTNTLRNTCSVGELVKKEWVENLNWMDATINKMLGIIDTLLILAGAFRKVSVEIKPLNMSHLIEQVIQQRLNPLLKEYKGEINLPENFPVAQGYAPWVEEIWVNYLSNGLKYGGQPPCLQVGADEILLENVSFIRFWVRDNGHGIPPEVQARLFTPSNRLAVLTHMGNCGLGLGLSVVQQIVERLGGKAGVESELEQGSLFYFTLPTYKNS